MAGEDPEKACELLVDGDLLLLVRTLVSKRGWSTCAISDVKGHADYEMVRRGRVRQVDKVGSDRADEAADFGRRGVPVDVTDCRGDLVQACQHWYHIVCVICTGSSLPLLGLRLLMMAWVVVLVTLWFGVLAPCPIGVRLLRQLGSLLCCLDHKLFGLVAGRIGLSVM